MAVSKFLLSAAAFFTLFGLFSPSFVSADAAADGAGPGSVHLCGPSGAAREGDVQPMVLEGGAGWAAVGGLSQHVRALKEMVILPLL